MKEKIIVSTLTLAASLAAYYYAKQHHRDVVPFTMVGGFVGAIVAEMIVFATDKKENS